MCPVATRLSGRGRSSVVSQKSSAWRASLSAAKPGSSLVDRDGGIRLHYTPNNLEPHQVLTRKLRHLLNHIGCEPHLLPQNAYFGKRLPIAGTGHQNGTVRFGANPASSALDINCRAHEIDNLYVVDGSFFPSSAAVNPTLTIIANALRVGDHVLERLGARSADR
jgi:choline dehydrogenase-like flavoprotein